MKNAFIGGGRRWSQRREIIRIVRIVSLSWLFLFGKAITHDWLVLRFDEIVHIVGLSLLQQLFDLPVQRILSALVLSGWPLHKNNLWLAPNLARRMVVMITMYGLCVPRCCIFCKLQKMHLRLSWEE